MDPINLSSGAITVPGRLNSNNKNKISFGSACRSADTFEIGIKKSKKPFFQRIIDSVRNTFSHNVEEDKNETNPEIGIEKSGKASFNHTFDLYGYDEIPHDDSQIPDTEIGKLLKSEDYEKKIKAASQGKYQDTTLEILSKDSLNFDIKLELANSGLSEKEFLDAIRKLSKSTFKAAFNKPTQYINYTQDAAFRAFQTDKFLEGFEFSDDNSEAKAYLVGMFRENITKLVKAIQYIDTDSLNQMMDKRSTGFKLMLNSLDELTPENGELLKELISHTREGDAKQKIKLCQLVHIFQKNKFDMNLLKNLARQDEIIDTASLNDMFKNAIIEKAGIENIDEKTNPNFNEEYFHLLFSNIPVMNNGVRDWTENFSVFLRETVKGSFEEFIADESNEYGKANKNTEIEFKKRRLDYEQWLHPDFDEKTFDVNGKKMTMKMWERNPHEDIFIGNKTRCCTAITTGANSAAMPLFLMNTAFNFIEVFDDKNEMKGMARIYMADIENKPAVIIDSIELSDIRQMSDEEKMIFGRNIYEYVHNYAQTTAKKPVKAYYIKSDSKLPHKRLQETGLIKNKFIGDVSADKLYSNRDAGCKWDDIREETHTVFCIPQ